MNAKEVWAFIWDWRFVIILLACAILKAVFDWKGFKEDIQHAMLAAKQMAKDGILKGGQAQEDWVVQKAMTLVPITLKQFVGEDTVRKWVRKLYKKGMDLIDDGKLNGSFPQT